MSDGLFSKDTNIESTDLIEGHGLYPVLSSALKVRAVAEPSSANGAQSFWPDEHFNLDRVSLFREADERERAEIVAGCCRDLLEEAYWIEKSGMYFAAKMSLLAPSTQERMLYSLFAADEATHFNWIGRYAARESVEQSRSPFITFLDDILRGDDRLVLTYVIQIVLEGWGINHYHALARGCRDEALRNIFEQIIKDEARHHASGVIIFNEQPAATEQVKAIVETVARLLLMVRSGPRAVVSQIERVLGRLSRPDKIKVFEELGSEAETAKKLDNLKTLIRSAARPDLVVGELERRGCFIPCSASECAGFGD